MKEIENVRLALNALAEANGQTYRAAVADLHVAAEALLTAMRAREAWLHKTDAIQDAQPDHPKFAERDRYWIKQLREYEAMRFVYAEAFRAVTAYAEVEPVEPEPVVAQTRMEGV